MDPIYTHIVASKEVVTKLAEKWKKATKKTKQKFADLAVKDKARYLTQTKEYEKSGTFTEISLTSPPGSHNPKKHDGSARSGGSKTDEDGPKPNGGSKTDEHSAGPKSDHGSGEKLDTLHNEKPDTAYDVRKGSSTLMTHYEGHVLPLMKGFFESALANSRKDMKEGLLPIINVLAPRTSESTSSTKEKEKEKEKKKEKKKKKKRKKEKKERRERKRRQEEIEKEDMVRDIMMKLAPYQDPPVQERHDSQRQGFDANSCSKWTNLEVLEWLKSNNLDMFMQVCRNKRISGAVLSTFGEEDLHKYFKDENAEEYHMKHLWDRLHHAQMKERDAQE